MSITDIDKLRYFQVETQNMYGVCSVRQIIKIILSLSATTSSMEYSYLQQPGFDSSCNLTGMPVSESTASQSFYRYSSLSHYNRDLTSPRSDLTSCGQMMSAANQYYRSSAAAAAQMRSVYNPAGKNQGSSSTSSHTILQECLGLAVTTVSWEGLKTPGAPCSDPL